MKKKIIITAIILFFIISFAGMTISFSEFQVYNPYKAFLGIVSIKFFNTKTLLIQWFPIPSNSFKTVYFAKPTAEGWDSIISMMENKNYIYREDLRLGGVVVFESKENGDLLHATVNFKSDCTVFGIFAKP